MSVGMIPSNRSKTILTIQVKSRCAPSCGLKSDAAVKNSLLQYVEDSLQEMLKYLLKLLWKNSTVTTRRS
ncbi:Small ribosomal subunit protein [Trichinella pseudospiralis]